jgi:hypothetical protein
MKMKAIHKYELKTDGAETELNLKQDFRIVHAEYVLVDKAVYIWVEEPLAAKSLPGVLNFWWRVPECLCRGSMSMLRPQ